MLSRSKENALSIKRNLDRLAATEGSASPSVLAPRMSITRRAFLGKLAASAAIGAAGLAATRLVLDLPGSALAADAPPPSPPSALPAAPTGVRSRLVSVFNPIVVRGDRVNEKYLAGMLDTGLTRFWGVDKQAEGWRKLLGEACNPNLKVLIKFNRSGADAIGTTRPMAAVLLSSLGTAGIKPDQVMLMDVSVETHRELETHPPIFGYEAEPVRVLGRDEHLALALAWADCIINVPFVKDHHMVGATCALKNLSHGLIKAPAQWHGERCRDAIGHICNLPQIRGKRKITICNALRIVYDGGPEARIECMVEHSRLFISTDMVAMDAFAARLVDQTRGKQGLKDLAEEHRPCNYLNTARELGLGQSDLDHIDVTELET